MFKWLKRQFNIYVFDPLAGGNGKIQMDEYAKVALVILTIYSAILEGRGPEQIYPDIYWIMMLTAICAIAGIKAVYKKDMLSKQNHSNPPQGEQL